MVAFGEDRSSILYNLFVDSSSRELNRKIMNAYFAENLRVYNGNVMACTNSAFDDISLGWTLLEYLLKHKATRSGSSTSQKYHCNGLEFDNPADMEDYKNAQGLK